MTTTTLKVYSVNLDGRKRGLVAARSWKRAAELLGVTVARATKYGSITGNAEDVAFALGQPETPFVMSMMDYRQGSEWQLKGTPK